MFAVEFFSEDLPTKSTEAEASLHAKPSPYAVDAREISPEAIRNLRKFLADDYRALNSLFSLSGYPEQRRYQLLG